MVPVGKPLPAMEHRRSPSPRSGHNLRESRVRAWSRKPEEYSIADGDTPPRASPPRAQSLPRFGLGREDGESSSSRPQPARIARRSLQPFGRFTNATPKFR